MWASRLEPSKQRASRRPLPNILRTCAYSVVCFVVSGVKRWWDGDCDGGVKFG